MSFIVQKFGGTSVADSGKILAAARRAIQARGNGKKVCVVVSARGHTTDELVALAREIHEHPPAREMDMLLSTGEQVSVALLAMAIESLGVPAISFTGAQIGIVTDSFHTKARIKNIDTRRMVEALDEGRIVIVAGFQGVDENYNITTLGRGGSDTTAVALAAVLRADACEIYTDVDGVFTTDPRIVPEARKIDRISYEEMLELASLGAGVMHGRSIEFAKKYGVPIHVRNSMSDTPGTWIVGDIDARRLGIPVTGAALARDEARISVTGVPDRPGIVHALFQPIADSQIVVDMIVQNIPIDGVTEVSFTVASADLAEALLKTEQSARAVGAVAVLHDPHVSKISVVGLGMRTHTGVAAAMFESLAKENINIQMITTSEIKISVLVDRNYAASGLRALHRAFELDRRIHDVPLGYEPRRATGKHAPEIPLVEANALTVRLGAMEELVISDILLDESQARITLFDVPNAPGQAARILREVSNAGVNVDMIVQTAGVGGSTHLSFTVPIHQLEYAVQSTKGAWEGLAANAGPIGVEPAVAKLSVLGVGMRSHATVAAQAFGALAERGINIVIINTSEISINLTTDSARGREALAALREVFGLSDNPA